MGSTPNHYKSIKCPFFCKDNLIERSITCEGEETETKVKYYFKNKDAIINWQHKYCYSVKNSSNCPIYKMANIKYEEGAD